MLYCKCCENDWEVTNELIEDDFGGYLCPYCDEELIDGDDDDYDFEPPQEDYQDFEDYNFPRDYPAEPPY